ncbi:MAG TPA: sigma-70 family RNA polymerase sigma factor [Proteobacteria bacterium]|nr:sigma-70 family RNA polymerase sigma factor [Pseudomonadota bacterium]
MERRSHPTPEMVLSGREDAARLSRAIELLEEAYRAPFLLKHVEGMSYGQISEVLGIEEGAARVRVHRARHALVAPLREV